MIIPLDSPETVTRVWFDRGFGLITECNTNIYIENVFRVRGGSVDGAAIDLDGAPLGAAEAAFLLSLREAQLVKLEVDAARAELTVTFEDSSLIAPRDPDFESWSVALSDGSKFIGTSDGVVEFP